MSVRLRLRRMGRKKKPYYRLVAADQRSARDGRFIEVVGNYDPLKHPHQLDLKEDRIYYWLDQGAQPSTTVKSLLRKKGVWHRLEMQKQGLDPEKIEEEMKKWELLQIERQKRQEASKLKKQKEKAAQKEAEKEEESKSAAAAAEGTVEAAPAAEAVTAAAEVAKTEDSTDKTAEEVTSEKTAESSEESVEPAVKAEAQEAAENDDSTQDDQEEKTGDDIAADDEAAKADSKDAK